MANPYQATQTSPIASQRSPSRWWIIYWLLSYFMPYLVLFVSLLLMGDWELGGRLSALLLLTPFVFGLIGTVWSLCSARLSVSQFTLLFLGTIMGYAVGCVVFFFVCIMVFGIVAT